MKVSGRIFLLLCVIMFTVMLNRTFDGRLSHNIRMYNHVNTVIPQEDCNDSGIAQISIIRIRQIYKRVEENTKSLLKSVSSMSEIEETIENTDVLAPTKHSEIVPSVFRSESTSKPLEIVPSVFQGDVTMKSSEVSSSVLDVTNSTNNSDNLDWLEKMENTTLEKTDENYITNDKPSDAVLEDDSPTTDVEDSQVSDELVEETPTESELEPEQSKPRILKRRLPRSQVTKPPKQRMFRLWKGNSKDMKERQRLLQQRKIRPHPVKREHTEKRENLESLHQDHNTIARCNHCRLFVGSHEKRYLYRDPRKVPVTNQTDFTIVSATTPQRLSFIPYLLKRWERYYSIVVKITKEEESMVAKRIIDMDLPKRVQIILFIVKKNEPYYEDFPVNLLRNIGIVYISTSHYLVLDMDMWPAHNLYSELQQLPDSILQSPSAATIVPAFFLKKPPILAQCNSLLSCAKVSESNFPRTRSDLLACLKADKCLLYKENTITHRYINSNWFRFPKEKHVVRMACLTNRFQEPYIVLRYSPSTLFYHEQFINYGCNKVQLIDHLRHLGYKFFILTNSFAMDIVHQDSKYRTTYISKVRGGNSPAMRLLCYDYQEQLDKKYPLAKNQTKLCRVNNLMLYKAI